MLNDRLKIFVKNNKQIFWFLLFAVQTLFYFISDFFNLNYKTVHIALDDKVPYLPIFIIPYILWYLYIPTPMVIACFKDKERFKRQTITVFTGAFLCTAFFYFFPTKIDFRPTPQGDGFLAWLCKIIYSNDTPTNVFPSLHCYQATAIHFSTFDKDLIRRRPVLFSVSLFFMIMTSVSTIFVKQHSVADLISGCLFGFFMSIVVKAAFKFVRKKEYTKA